MSLKFGAILIRGGTFPQVLGNFEKTLIVAIKQGGIAEAAIGSVIETVNSIINRTLFLVAKWSP